MYELIKAGEYSYYIECPARVGIFKVGEGRAVLIDSGNDRSMGKRIKKLLDAEGLVLDAIYNTHHHADHIGANRYLSELYGCKIYAPREECGFIENTLLEPALLYGANPPSALRRKFLVAEPSRVEPLTSDALPSGLEMISLTGHTPAMVGFRTCDGVAYLADCLSSKETLEKYKICVIYDVAAYLETLEAVKYLESKLFVPAHAAATESIAPLAQYNIDAVKAISQRILLLAREPITPDILIKRLFDEYSLIMTFEQYAMVGSTVRSYITYLLGEGLLDTVILDNALFVVAR